MARRAPRMEREMARQTGRGVSRRMSSLPLRMIPAFRGSMIQSAQGWCSRPVHARRVGLVRSMWEGRSQASRGLRAWALGAYFGFGVGIAKEMARSHRAKHRVPLRPSLQSSTFNVAILKASSLFLLGTGDFEEHLLVASHIFLPPPPSLYSMLPYNTIVSGTVHIVYLPPYHSYRIHATKRFTTYKSLFTLHV